MDSASVSSNEDRNGGTSAASIWKAMGCPAASVSWAVACASRADRGSNGRSEIAGAIVMATSLETVTGRDDGTTQASNKAKAQAAAGARVTASPG
jgi:hypothetical protein